MQDMEHHIRVAEFTVDLLENKFKVGRHRFGLEPVIGLVPFIGDLVSFFISYYVVWIAIQLRLPQDKIDEMHRNIFIDFLLGIIPGVGDFADFVYKANSKNLKIIKEYAPHGVVEGQIVL